MVICYACKRGFHKYHDVSTKPVCACEECVAAEKAAVKAKEKEKAEAS